MKKTPYIMRQHETCLLNYLLLDFHLSGGAARPSSAVKKHLPWCIARPMHSPFNRPPLTFLPAWPPGKIAAPRDHLHIRLRRRESPLWYIFEV